MSIHEIYKKRLTITRRPRGRDAKRRNIQERPATLGHFTIEELFHILNYVILYPHKLTHVFRFDHGTYLVRPHAPTEESGDFDESEEAD